MDWTELGVSDLINGFDYDNQAWVIDGKYVRCGHRINDSNCNCYGRIHEGEHVSADVAEKLNSIRWENRRRKA